VGRCCHYITETGGYRRLCIIFVEEKKNLYVPVRDRELCVRHFDLETKRRRPPSDSDLRDWAMTVF
jgi:hypothetical protein